MEVVAPQRRRVSSAGTTFRKWLGIASALVTSVLPFFYLRRLGGLGSGPFLVVPLVWIAGSVYTLRGALRLRHVDLEPGQLLVERSGGWVSVPFAEVRDISYRRRRDGSRIVVKLHTKGPLGTSVEFLPPTRFLAAPFSEPPIMDELRWYLQQARVAAGPWPGVPPMSGPVPSAVWSPSAPVPVPAPIPPSPSAPSRPTTSMPGSPDWR